MLIYSTEVTQTVDELERLIEEQQLDMAYGHRVKRTEVAYRDGALASNHQRNTLPKVKVELHPLDTRHGTVRGYRLGCKCSRCRDAVAEYQFERRHRDWPWDSIPHGTTGGYRNYSCRCESCTEANTQAIATYRRNRGIHQESE